MRRRSAAAVSTTTPRSDSSSAIRRSSSSDGDSSARTIARSAFASPRTMNGSTGHATNNPVRVIVNVAIPHGSRISSYSIERQPTGSFTLIHTCATNPSAPPRIGSGLGSSTVTSSSARARIRSSLPS